MKSVIFKSRECPYTKGIWVNLSVIIAVFRLKVPIFVARRKKYLGLDELLKYLETDATC